MNLADILIETANRYPDRTAIVFYDNRIRYGELHDRAFRFAAALGNLEIGPGDRVAIALPNVPEFAYAFYGALAAGAEIVLINPLYTDREIKYFFRDADVKLVVTHPMFAESVSLAAQSNTSRLIYSTSMGDPAKIDIESVSKDVAPVESCHPREPRDTAIIVYTNAYRGTPLGACLTHGGLLFDADACRKAALVTEEDSFLSALPIFHAFSLTVCLNLPVLCGGTTVFHETFQEARIIDALDKEPISIFPAVPTMYKKLLDSHGGEGRDYSSVKAFIPGGAPPVNPTLLDDFRQAFNANVYEGYGITECGPVTSVNPISKKENRPGSIGLPLNEIYVKIVDENGAELPTGETGELLVRGDNVMEKYLNRPDETGLFLRDGWFYTGDLARLDEDGFIYLRGLKKRMILVGGFNVYPAEVEIELSAHPAVESCRVFGAADENLGERSAAQIKLRPGMEASKVELQKFLRKSLAPYKVPRIIEFID